MTRTMPTDPFFTERFELPDLLVTLCEAGQTSLAARIARSLFTDESVGDAGRRTASNDSGTPVELRDEGQRTSEDVGVACDEPKATRTVKALQRYLKPARRRR